MSQSVKEAGNGMAEASVKKLFVRGEVETETVKVYLSETKQSKVELEFYLAKKKVQIIKGLFFFKEA